MAASRDTTSRDSSRREFSDKQPSGQRSQDRRRRRGDDGPGGGAAVAPLESRERPANVDAERAVLGSILLTSPASQAGLYLGTLIGINLLSSGIASVAAGVSLRRSLA
jgi:hypothetical protein